MKIISSIKPIFNRILHLNILYIIFLLILICLSFYFLYKSREIKEMFTTGTINSTTYYYIPDIRDISDQVLTDISSVSLDISKIKTKKIKITFNELIKETLDMIDYYKTDYANIENPENEEKYKIDVIETSLYKKIQQIKDSSSVLLDKEFSHYFSNIDQQTILEFNEKIIPYNYLLNAVSLHVSDENTTINGKNKMQTYFLRKMAEYRGNIGQLNDLKAEFYTAIEPAFTIRTIFNEYLSNIQFYNDNSDMQLLLNTAKDTLLTVRENQVNWLNDITLRIYQYVDICHAIWQFLSKCEQTKEQINGFFIAYGNHMYGQEYILNDILYN